MLLMFSPFMPGRIFYLSLWKSPFPFYGMGCLFCVLVLSCFIEIPVSHANNVDPDQTPRSAASDLDLHCLQMSLFIGCQA